MEPPVSDPKEAMHNPALVADPDPELELPGRCSKFQGFRADGNNSFSSPLPKANSLIASLPSITAPALFKR